jgi:hypothetical protein
MHYSTTALLVALASTVSAQAGNYQQCKIELGSVGIVADLTRRWNQLVGSDNVQLRRVCQDQVRIL